MFYHIFAIFSMKIPRRIRTILLLKGACMNYFLILIAAILFTIQTVCFKEFTKRYMKNMASYFLFNFLYFSVISIILIIAAGGVHPLHAPTVYLGITFGSLFIIAILSYMKAMETGSLSYAALFFSFGILVPTLVGLIFWNEKLGLLQLGGLILLLSTLYIMNTPAAGEDKKVNTKWFIFCIIAFLTNGGLMTIMKEHQTLLPGIETREFLFLSFGTAALLSILIFGWYKLRSKQAVDVSHLKGPFFWMIVLGTGITTAFGNLLGMILASRMPAVLQFPMTSGTIILLTTIASMVIYKEKIMRKGIFGLCLGVLAIILLSLK